jgi:hypothetical protein
MRWPFQANFVLSFGKATHAAPGYPTQASPLRDAGGQLATGTPRNALRLAQHTNGPWAVVLTFDLG